MASMTMRERLLAVLQRRELDQVPLIMYEDLMPIQYKAIRLRDQVRATFGNRIGLLRWSAIHKVLTPNCHFETQDYYIGETLWERTTLLHPQVRYFRNEHWSLSTIQDRSASIISRSHKIMRYYGHI